MPSEVKDRQPAGGTLMSKPKCVVQETIQNNQMCRIQHSLLEMETSCTRPQRLM